LGPAHPGARRIAGLIMFEDGRGFPCLAPLPSGVPAGSACLTVSSPQCGGRSARMSGRCSPPCPLVLAPGCRGGAFPHFQGFLSEMRTAVSCIGAEAGLWRQAAAAARDNPRPAWVRFRAAYCARPERTRPCCGLRHPPAPRRSGGGRRVPRPVCGSRSFRPFPPRKRKPGAARPCSGTASIPPGTPLPAEQPAISSAGSGAGAR